jgi:hypothetical protein
MEYRIGGEPGFPSAFEGDLRGLLSSLYFENVMHGRLIRKTNILDAYSSLVEQHRSILSRLEERLTTAS